MSKTTKILLSLTLALVLLLSGIVAVPYYAFGIDIFDRSGWETDETGQIRYLDYYGDPLTGWQLIEDNWYYFSLSDSTMVTGWLDLEGTRYFLKTDGTRHLGWLEQEEGIYYFDPASATLSTGWLHLEEGSYFLDSTGLRQYGWLDQEGSRYYLDEQGLMVTGWLEQDGNRYYLGEDGVMATGWLETEEGRRYLNEEGILCSGWTDTPEGRFYLTEEGFIATGWLETPEGLYYLDENGQPVTGWQEVENRKYYLNETGLMVTGWQELDGSRYYFLEDGTMAVGKVLVDETACYFTSTGKYVVLVNRWNQVPEDYSADLVEYNGWKVSRECYDDLVSLLKDAGQVGYYQITSAYRSIDTQRYIWEKRMQGYLDSGYSRDGAYTAVLQSVAIPGTSEHHLGLAVDISAGTTVQSWLAQNSWRYGFILRYPEGKTSVTGIVYEPWHFRYVGHELAKELYDLGLTMEEYMDMLTEQAGTGSGTASDPEVFG